MLFLTPPLFVTREQSELVRLLFVASALVCLLGILTKCYKYKWSTITNQVGILCFDYRGK